MNRATLMQKWKETPKSRHWLGVLILVLVVAIGIQGVFIHRLSIAMEKERYTNSKPGLKGNNPDPFGFSDPWSSDPWKGSYQNPFEQMNKMREEMDRFFNSGTFPKLDSDSLFGHGLFSSPMDGIGDRSISGFSVQIEDDAVVVTGKVPGADQSNIDVTLENNQLRITARTEGSENQNKESDDFGNMTRRSQFSSRFEKRITLPDDVEASGMKTEFKDGVLTVRIPRMSSTGIF